MSVTDMYQKPERPLDVALPDMPATSVSTTAAQTQIPVTKPTPMPVLQPVGVDGAKAHQLRKAVAPQIASVKGNIVPSVPVSARSIPAFEVDNEQQPAEPTITYDGLDDVIKEIERRRAALHVPTKEDLFKEARRHRTNSIISAIADGASALSNLIFTTQYAPNMYSASNSMSARAKARYDEMKKKYDEDADKYLNYSLQIGRLKDAQEQKQYQRGRDALADRIRMSQEDRAQAKADRDAAMAEIQYQVAYNNLDKQAAAAKIKEIEAEYADRYWQSRINKNNRSGRGAGGGSRKNDEWYAYNKDGDVVVIHASNEKQAWSKAPEGYTIRQKPVEETSTKTETEQFGSVVSSKTKTTSKETNASGKTGGVPAPKKAGKKWSNTSKIEW